MNQGYYIKRGFAEWAPLDAVPVAHIIKPGRRQLARLEADVLYVGRMGSRSMARAGMIYDGGSKPRWSWLFAGHPWGEYLPSYTIHDADCQTIRHLFDSGAITHAEAHLMRRKADRRFLEGLRWLARHKLAQGGAWARWLARAKYRAVRCHAWATIGRTE